MFHSPLASRFGRGFTSARATVPLTDDQIRAAAPSIWATEKHESRSERYAYIPTGEILKGLRKQGFEAFSVAQTRVRDEGKREHAKHMLRLRHASQIQADTANEIILLNSHDGTSAYQMLAGVFRFVCCNGLVIGETQCDIRVKHSGNVQDNVIEGAFKVLEGFELVDQQREGMRALTLNHGEQQAFARAALALRYDEDTPAPITETQILQPRRSADLRADMWTTLNVTQENLIRGGVQGRSANGRRMSTREVRGIDQGVKINRALWTLAEEMRKLKAAA